MRTYRIVYVAVSGHGYGHLSQLAPVVNMLCQRDPALKFMVRTDLPESIVRAHIIVPFDLIASAPDIGMVMRNPLDVDVDQSFAQYSSVHADWEHHVTKEMEHLRQISPALLLGNIPYLLVAAAARVKIPSILLCSLNWAEIFAGYCRQRPGALHIVERINSAYNQAEMCLNPTPSMPMPGIRNSQTIAPVARMGTNRRAELDAKFSLRAGDKLVMVSFGGIAGQPGITGWPRLPGVVWLNGRENTTARTDMLSLAECGMPYIDALCSSDGFVMKPGYGSAAEAVCNRIPFLYVRRRDWPEEASIVAWMERYGRGQEITRVDFDRGHLAATLNRLWAMPEKAAITPDGAEQAADLIAPYLR